MQLTNEEARNLYGGRVRARVCGICIHEGKILLINHSLYGHRFFMPPGGGIEFGETAANALKREFLEETGLVVRVGSFLFTHEFIGPELHGIELFFEVHIAGGNFGKGSDPEFSESGQIMDEARWVPWEQLKSLQAHERHSVFGLVNALDELRSLPAFIPA